MKKIGFILTLFSIFTQSDSFAQSTYGNTLNAGIGIGGYGGYYRYAGRSLPVFHINYEFDVAKNFTLAPFANIYSYSTTYNGGNQGRAYKYNEIVIPIGVKGTYYLDDLVKANANWDFYIAGSLGFALVNSRWEEGYTGDRKYFNRNNGLILDFHVGTEYHFNKRIGAFLDLSSGISTIGLAFHGK